MTRWTYLFSPRSAIKLYYINVAVVVVVNVVVVDDDAAAADDDDKLPRQIVFFI